MEKFGLKVKNKRELVNVVNRLRNKTSRTPQEKFEFLDERDKIAKFGND